MLFSRDSLYGWGVCRIPMPRSAVDRLTDRRKQRGRTGFPDRRAGETARGEELTALLRLLRDDVPWGKSLLACSLILGLLLLLGRLAPAPSPPATPLASLEITVQLKAEPPPRLAPVAAPLPPSPVETNPVPPLPEAAAEPIAVVPPPATRPQAAAPPELLPAPVLPRYEPPPPAPPSQRLSEASRLQRAAAEIDLTGPTGVGDYRRKSAAAGATLPEQAPQLAAAQATLELDGPRSLAFSPPPAVSRAAGPASSGTTFAPAAPSQVELPTGPGAPQPARPVGVPPTRGLPGGSQPTLLAAATPELALPAPGQRLPPRTRPAAPAVPALPGGTAPAFPATRATEPMLPVPAPAGRPGPAGTATPAPAATAATTTAAVTTAAVTLPRKEEVDPRYLVDLNTVRECSGQDDEIGLKTQLATLLQTEGNCIWQGSVFYFSRPDSAYSLQVQLYNAAGFPYNNRCEGYRQAIRCVKSQRP